MSLSSPEPEITLRLPQSVLNTVLAYLHAGKYAEVAVAIACIHGQAVPQLAALSKLAEAEAQSPRAQ